MIPAFNESIVLPTAKIRRQNRKSEDHFDLRSDLDFQCFFKRVVPLWNTLPKNIKTKKNAFIKQSRRK